MKLAVIELGSQRLRRQDHRRARERPAVGTVHHAGWSDSRLEPRIERDIPGLHLERLRNCRLIANGLDPHGHGRNGA